MGEKGNGKVYFSRINEKKTGMEKDNIIPGPGKTGNGKKKFFPEWEWDYFLVPVHAKFKLEFFVLHSCAPLPYVYGLVSINNLF